MYTHIIYIYTYIYIDMHLGIRGIMVSVFNILDRNDQICAWFPCLANGKT